MKRFFLIDGHAQIFRAYYAPFQPLTSPAGEPVKATHIFTQMLLSILREQRPDYFAVAMDVSDATTFRREIDADYKATRDEAPEDLAPQIERIVEVIELLGIPLFRVPGYEADDVIATIAEKLAGVDVELSIVSKDKDLYQLLNRNVHLWDPVTGEVLDDEGLRAKHGFGPELAVEIQTLTGDKTDNVPGIHLVGVKKAVALLAKYGSAAAVIEHADELTPKMRENVLAFRDQLETTRDLVTLRRDVPVEFDLQACERRPLASEKLRPLLKELGLNRILTQLDTLAAGNDSASTPDAPVVDSPGAEGATERDGATGMTKTTPGSYTAVVTPAAFEEFVAALSRQKVFAFDTETTSLRPVDCELVGLSFSWATGDAYYLPLRSHLGKTLPFQETLARLKPFLEDASIKKCGQNLKYDVQVLRTVGIAVRGVHFDTMVASYLLHPERRGHGMDDLAKDLLGHETIPISTLIGKGKHQTTLLEANPQELTDYAAEDAEITWRLYELLKPLIDASPMKSLYYDVEVPLVEVLAAMESAGVKLDTQLLRSISDSMAERIESLKARVQEAAGHEFVIDSPKQLSAVLFDELGLRVVKKTKTGRSTDAEVLRVLAAESDHPLPQLVLEYRELAKLRGTYVDPLPQLVSPKTGRLHASFHQTVTATGRLSSSDPNIQNIPIRTEQGREIRRAFVPSTADDALIVADYSQIELRVLAHFSQDENLIEAFRNDQDIHAAVAAQVAGVAIEDVTREERTRAKAINFGIIYGQGAFGLANTLGIPRRQAADFIDAYKKRYRGIVEFMDRCVSDAQESGKVSTLLGRHRPIPEIYSRNRMRRALGERLAINTVVQGTAADIIKVAMVRLHRRILSESLPLVLLIQVHDELVLESPKKDVQRMAQLVRSEMENAIELTVALKVDVAFGDSWLEAK